MGWHPVAAVRLHLHTNSTQNTKNKTYIAKQKKMWSEKCGPCPVCASYTLAFALQLREAERPKRADNHSTLATAGG